MAPVTPGRVPRPPSGLPAARRGCGAVAGGMSPPRPSRPGAAVREACLLAAASYAGLHLLLWLSVAPEGLVRIALADDSAGERVQGAAVLLGLGLCGGAGVWWPLRARARASRGDALRCAGLALAYLALILPASLRPPGAPVGPTWLGTVAEAGSLLVVPLLLPVAAADGGAGDVVWVAGPYAALLLLGAALTFAEGMRRERPPPRAVRHRTPARDGGPTSPGGPDRR